MWAKLKSLLWTSGRDSSGPTLILWSVGPLWRGVNISEELTWTTHIQTQVKKARQRLYHLRQLRKFRVSPAILKTFYSGAIECVLTQCISVWYGNVSNQDCKALQSCALSWAHLRVCSSLLCRTSTSNAAKAELLKSPRTQITQAAISSFYCQLPYYLFSIQYTVLQNVFAHFIILYFLFLFLLYFFITIFMYILLCLLHIIVMSMEQTWLTFHCWLYSV